MQALADLVRGGGDPSEPRCRGSQATQAKERARSWEVNGVLCCTEDQTRSESGLKMSHKMQSHPWVEGTQVLFCAAECQCSKLDRQVDTIDKRPRA